MEDGKVRVAGPTPCSSARCSFLFSTVFQGSGVGGRGRGVEHGASVPSTTAPQPGAAGEVGRGSPWDWALAPLSLAMGD